ncbi:MAG: response regulator transcription factor [Ignavibacterium sp.]
MSMRVSIVEDDSRIRESLIVLIDGTEGFRCVSAYENAEEALEDIPRKAPDVVLMDINLPGISGIECVRGLKDRMPDLQIIMLTVFEDSERIFQSLEAGATGYLLKRTPPDQILSAIREVCNGGSPMSSQIARKVVQSFRKTRENSNPPVKLSPREEEILSALAKGSRDKEIAEALFISVDTVHSHLRRIYEKLQVRSRTEAVVKYLRK